MIELLSVWIMSMISCFGICTVIYNSKPCIQIGGDLLLTEDEYRYVNNEYKLKMRNSKLCDENFFLTKDLRGNVSVMCESGWGIKSVGKNFKVLELDETEIVFQIVKITSLCESTSLMLIIKQEIKKSSEYKGYTITSNFYISLKDINELQIVNSSVNSNLYRWFEEGSW